ncbi:hypothetical protein D3C86_1447700 [compost metagenome]
MQVRHRSRHATGDVQRLVDAEAPLWRIAVAGAAGQRRRLGQRLEARGDQLQQQPRRGIRLRGQRSGDADQVGMGAGGDAGGHLAVRQAVAGDVALEQLGGHGMGRLVVNTPVRAADDAGGALSQHLAQLDAVAGDRRQRMLGQYLRLAGVAERVAGEGQPGQPRQLQEHLWQSFEAVGGDAQQLQALQVGQAVRQGAQAVAGQRQLLQAGAAA